ncbi:MAG TPA: hypothetical protein VGS16_05650 [Candidatus Dormibacteraeota bacterium]|nr:hypothetical protein [Candidatus Dormibacteraeota bacterium]
MELRKGQPLGAFALFAWSPGSRSPRLPTTLLVDPDEVILGRALAARVADATRMTAAAAIAKGLVELGSPRFAKPIQDVHYLTSRVIARFLITGEGTTEQERNFISRLGVIGACYGMSIATLTRSYLVWRDTNLRILSEEVNRLGIGQAVAEMARKIIKSSADTGILRTVRAYDYQIQLATRSKDGVTIGVSPPP